MNNIHNNQFSISNIFIGIFTSLIGSIVFSVIVFFFSFSEEVEKIIEIPNTIEIMNSKLEKINKLYSKIDKIMNNIEKSHRNVYTDMDGNVSVGILMESNLKTDSIVVVHYKDSLLFKSNKVKNNASSFMSLRGKSIVLRGEKKGVEVMIKLFISEVSRKPTDIEKGVDLFISKETAYFFTNKPKIGILNLNFKIIDTK